MIQDYLNWIILHQRNTKSHLDKDSPIPFMYHDPSSLWYSQPQYDEGPLTGHVTFYYYCWGKNIFVILRTSSHRGLLYSGSTAL